MDYNIFQFCLLITVIIILLIYLTVKKESIINIFNNIGKKEIMLGLLSFTFNMAFMRIEVDHISSLTIINSLLYGLLVSFILSISEK